MSSLKRTAAFFALFLFCLRGIAHDVPVHELITQNAVDSAGNMSASYRSIGFISFLSSESSDIEFVEVRKQMISGSRHEDDPETKFSQQDLGKFRSVNHFYDPYHKDYGQGLSDFPEDSRSQNVPILGPISEGVNSFQWASSGPDSQGLHGAINEWSWQNARNFEWTGLTDGLQSSRQTALQNMFRAVGQVMHLLEDTTQPQHVRNEQHLDTFLPYVNTPWRSVIEDYGKANKDHLSYDPGVLDWRSAGFSKLEDFWDRHLYNGTSPAPLDADAQGTQILGLAEFSNGNLLGARHKYAEYYESTSIKYYPYPSRDHGTDYKQKRAHLANAVDTLTFRNGHQGQALYMKKITDGVPVDHHSRFDYLGAKLGFGMVTINDPDVLYDYHKKLIPKAVKYAAGLIDYYFRGIISTSVTSGQDAQYQISIKNGSSQRMSSGNFQLYWDDIHGNRTLIDENQCSFDYPNALDPDDDFTATFTAQDQAVRYVLIYQGTFGTAADGTTALDPVDDGLAIAVASLTVPAINGTTPSGNVGAAYSASVTSANVDSPSFSVDGSLPPGLSMNATGQISGTPTSGGVYMFKARVTSGVTGYSYEKDFSITINSPCDPNDCECNDTCV